MILIFFPCGRCIFHTDDSLALQEERLSRYQKAMGMVIHTATFDDAAKFKRVEEQLRTDEAWTSRVAQLEVSLPPLSTAPEQNIGVPPHCCRMICKQAYHQGVALLQIPAQSSKLGTLVRRKRRISVEMLPSWSGPSSGDGSNLMGNSDDPADEMTASDGSASSGGSRAGSSVSSGGSKGSGGREAGWSHSGDLGRSSSRSGGWQKERMTARQLVYRLVHLIDTDGDGKISVSEGIAYLYCAGHEPDEVEQDWANILEDADHLEQSSIPAAKLAQFIVAQSEMDAEGFFVDDRRDGEILGQLHRLELGSGTTSHMTQLTHLELQRIDSVSSWVQSGEDESPLKPQEVQILTLTGLEETNSPQELASPVTLTTPESAAGSFRLPPGEALRDSPVAASTPWLIAPRKTAQEWAEELFALINTTQSGFIEEAEGKVRGGLRIAHCAAPC